MARVANSAPLTPHGASTGGPGYRSDLTAGEMRSKRKWTLYSVKLDGLSGIADDTFVYGKSEQEHDQHILNVLDTARDNNVWFNPDKFQLEVDQTSFFGFTWAPDGLRADDLKIKATTDMSSPQNLAELQTFWEWSTT